MAHRGAEGALLVGLGALLGVGTAMTNSAGLLCSLCMELDVFGNVQISLLTFCGDSVAQRTPELLIICTRLEAKMCACKIDGDLQLMPPKCKALRYFIVCLSSHTAFMVRYMCCYFCASLINGCHSFDYSVMMAV